jgi:hypothetical protein
MGATMSVDTGSTSCIDPTTTETTATTATTFEDKLRQEVILIPEDIEDIHIQGDDIASVIDERDAATTTTDTPADNTRYGKGKHWKKNLKKKQSAAAAAATDGIPPTPTERTIEQRREQVRPIIDKLTELQMNVSYPAIRELYKQLSQFIKTGEDAKIKIPFPEFSRRIKGELSNATYIPCWVKLEME